MALRAAVCCLACLWCACNHAKQRDYMINIIAEHPWIWSSKSGLGTSTCSAMAAKKTEINDTQYVSETSYDDQDKGPRITWFADHWIQIKNYDLMSIISQGSGRATRKGHLPCRRCDWDPATSSTYDHHLLVCGHLCPSRWQATVIGRYPATTATDGAVVAAGAGLAEAGRLPRF